MQIISIRRRKKALPQAVKVLQAGGIVAHPTDTCYGFAASIFSKKAIAKLYKLKKMPRIKPVSILVSTVSEAKKYGIWNKSADALAKKYWPGPLTLVLKRKKTLPSWFNPKTKTIGIRVPDHSFSKLMVKKFSSPVTTTSANISGLKSPYSVAEILRQFKKQTYKPDLIIDGGILDKKNPPSAVIDVSGKKPKILRHGVVTK